MTTCDVLTLEIDPPYIGSAVSPTVEIEETREDVTITITDVNGDHSYTVEKTDAAIAEAEQAARDANSAAQAATASAQAADESAQNADNMATSVGNAWSSMQGSITQSIQATYAAANRADSAATTADSAASTAREYGNKANTEALNARNAADAANTAAQDAQAATQDATAATTAANDAADSANDAAQSATTAAGDATQAASDANQAAQDATQAAQSAQAIVDDIEDGYYPNMSVGTSDALMGDDAADESWLQRVSTHDGAARIESLRGNTVRWNQLIQNGDFSDGTNGWGVTAGVTTEIVGGVLHIQTTTSTYIGLNRLSGFWNCVAGHKYLIVMYAKSSSGKIMIIPTSVTAGGFVQFNDISNGRIVSWIYEPTSNQTSQWGLRFLVTASGTSETLSVELSNYMAVDLTAAFGAGNEPATVEEFEAMFPEDYYPYDAGSLLSVDISGISSAGVTREIPAATYFPTGLKSAGSVYDELTADKAITRIGAVDLGTLSWMAEAAWQQPRGLTRLWATVPNAETTNSENVIASGYFTTNLPVLASSMSTAYCIAMINGRVYVTVPYPDIASKADFVTWLQTHPVTIYYADATPTETAINPPLNMSYKTEQGGTERFVSTSTSSPQTATPRLAIVYGYTADGLIDEASSIIAPVESGSASTNYAIGGYFVMGGKLYKATRAIASGETITPGTNCTATDVMAEIVALTS